MERLTFEGNFCDAQCRENPCPYNGSCSQREVWERLKQYEDTGLSPVVCEIAGKAEAALSSVGWTVDRAAELLKADKEGRVVVLPCRVGDTMIDQTFEEAPALMKNIRLEIAYERICGVIYHIGYDVFADLVEHGRIRPVSEEAEEALRRAENGRKEETNHG